ncbi:IBR domain-containing protein [Xylariaceae sp. FL0594]|nr:IBR domain-containing protein [Xylariaceae sp. FL0594]
MDSSLRSSLLPGPAWSAGGALSDAQESDYLIQVLQITAPALQTYLDGLLAKAERFGLTLAQLSAENTVTETSSTLVRSGPDTNGPLDASHVRSVSADSRSASASTAKTTYSSKNGHGITESLRKRPWTLGLSFTHYERYLADVVDQNLDQPMFLTSPATAGTVTSPGIFGMGTYKSYRSIRNSILKLRDKAWSNTARCSETATISCTACREDSVPDASLRRLPCGHSYCSGCLGIMINQASTEESRMPPRCCTQPVPTSLIKSTLSREEQIRFLKAVLQFSTPWAVRIFCPNPSCCDFIPPRPKADPKHPFQVVCRKCKTRVCVMCKRSAHPPGQDCPDDWELEAVLKMGERSGWRRCYKCRSLVELTQGCTHMICRCRAQFCYVCGAVWDPLVGCPNFCNGEEEMDRRRQEEEDRLAVLEAEEAIRQEAAAREAAEKREAEERTRNCPEFRALRARQAKELERFGQFEQRTKWALWTRQAQQKLALVERHSTAMEKMKDRHAKTAANLEDRQVIAEMELRSMLEQSEKNVRTRLRHMRAYCDGPGQSPTGEMPARVVTERNLRELGQQYNLAKNMKQLHQARINVMRDQQAKALEQLLERQESELQRLAEKNEREKEQLESEFADKEDALSMALSARQSVLELRWRLEMEVTRKELEAERGLQYAPFPSLEWPQGSGALEDGHAVKG